MYTLFALYGGTNMTNTLLLMFLEVSTGVLSFTQNVANISQGSRAKYIHELGVKLSQG